MLKARAPVVRSPRLFRRSPSLRARLLAGLIALTTVFLVVMGVVTIVVLGTLEQNQLNAEVRLASRQSVGGIAAGADGFAAAYLSPRQPQYGHAHRRLADRRDPAHRGPQPRQAVQDGRLRPAEQAGGLRAAVRPPRQRRADGSGRLALRAQPGHHVGQAHHAGRLGHHHRRPPGERASNNMHGIVLTELITGGALIALLASAVTG